MDRIDQTHLRSKATLLFNGRAAVAALSALLLPACFLDRSGTGPGYHWDGGGGSTYGSTTSSGGGESSPEAYRRPISITAGAAAVPADYSIAIRFDHGALVAQGKSAPGGDDVRILHVVGGQEEELDRVLDPESSWGDSSTMLWFSTRVGIDAGSIDDAYWIEYGDARVTPPLADASRIFSLWDDFEGSDLDPRWGYNSIGTAEGGYSLEDGALRLTAKSGDIAGTSDSFAFLHVPMSGDFSAESMVIGYDGLLDSQAKVGGVMVRQSLGAGSRHRFASRMTEGSLVTGARVSDGGNVTLEKVPATSDFDRERSRIDRIGSHLRAFSSKDGADWDALGDAVDLVPQVTDPLYVGTMLATKQQMNEGSVDVGWFRVRKLVDPEPSAELGEEKTIER